MVDRSQYSADIFITGPDPTHSVRYRERKHLIPGGGLAEALWRRVSPISLWQHTTARGFLISKKAWEGSPREEHDFALSTALLPYR